MNYASKIPIIILHGWAKDMTGDRYHELKNILEKHHYSVYSPDLPGFGKEKLQKEVMTVDDYVDFLKSFAREQKHKKIILIGHSFGGRIATKFAYLHPDIVQKLVITGSPLTKRKLSLKKSIARVVAASGKIALSYFPQNTQNLFKKLLYKSIGEWDYYKSGNLRETFKAIVREDLSSILPGISVPTIIVWGEHDTFVPVSDAQDISRRIPNSRLVIIPDASHKLPYENPIAFYKAISSFL